MDSKTSTAQIVQNLTETKQEYLVMQKPTFLASHSSVLIVKRWLVQGIPLELTYPQSGAVIINSIYAMLLVKLYECSMVDIT